MRLTPKNKSYGFNRKKNGFAIPQVLILGVGIAIGVSGLMAASILGLTGSRIKRQELIAKSSSYSGITTVRGLLNDNSEDSFYHYLWLLNIKSCSEKANECNRYNDTNPSIEYWSDDEWCDGLPNCLGRQKAPMCAAKEEIDWGEIMDSYGTLLDNVSDSVGANLKNSTREFNQAFNIRSTKYIGTEQYGVSSILIEGIATSNKTNIQTASNKVRVNIQVNSKTPEAGFGFLAIGENESDEIDSLFLGNLSITTANDGNLLSSTPKGSIIWRRNIYENSDECGKFLENAKYTGSSLPENVDGGIWVQPIGMPKQPRLSNVDDIGILICTPAEIQKINTNCKLNSKNSSEKVYRIHSLYAKGPGSKFEVSTTDDSKVILEIMGDIDISNGGIFCHKDGANACGSGKGGNLTILFKQKTNINGNKIVCNDLDQITGGVKFKASQDFANYKYPIDNNKLPGSSFLIDSTGENPLDTFAAFVYGPKLTFISVRPESQWVQVTNSEKGNNNAGMIVTTRASYGWIKDTLSNSLENRMVNIILTPNSNLIPYLGQKDLSFKNEDEANNIEIVGVGYKVSALPAGSFLNPSANRVFLIYNSLSQSYYLRTFDIQNINPATQSSSEYSYPRAFAKMNYESNATHVDLQDNLDSSYAKEWLNAFGIKVEKSNINQARNFSGAAWVKNLCFDGSGQKTWSFSKDFIDKISIWHGTEFNWGVQYYRGRSVILWDTLREFDS
ncbi:hypothetical protein [Prochlorococcus sp. MIT 1307]|uniref:hypothetical protein n=1 Tax=Prochlorococcus sp. MIT 1307 TaxID=3096219 RepID=UPI002A758EF4|nr:hypothetical protein [Prochlorococcus sp. MIT 1307]